jgi:hypothetical protein
MSMPGQANVPAHGHPEPVQPYRKESIMASTKLGDKQGEKEQGKQGDRTSRRGFASMDPNQQRAIASEGGRAAHRSGNAHEFTSEEARRAGSMSRKNSANRGAEASANRGASVQESSDTTNKLA